MTQERTGVSEGASVQATPAAPPPADPGPLHPADSPAGPTFTLEAAKTEIERLIAEHQGAQAAEHRLPTAIELGQKQLQDLEAELLQQHNASGPIQQLHGLQVIPVNEPDHVGLVYSGVAGA